MVKAAVIVVQQRIVREHNDDCRLQTIITIIIITNPMTSIKNKNA